MTAQEIFNTVAAHLLRQGRKAEGYGTQPGCAYRSNDGDKCAVGCLIPDDDYSIELEGAVVTPNLLEDTDRLAFREKFLKDVLIRLGLLKHVHLLRSLQAIHDDKEPAMWLAELHRLAVGNGFDRSALPPFPPKHDQASVV